MRLSPEKHIIVYGSCTILCLLMAIFYAIIKDTPMIFFSLGVAALNAIIVHNPPKDEKKR